MKEGMKFNSQICTSREQSERLLALGLKPETADMVLVPSSRHDGSDVIRVRKSYLMEEDAIPAWSMHRMMCLVFNSGGTYVELFEDDDAYEILMYKIEMRIKDGYFNKEYLV